MCTTPLYSSLNDQEFLVPVLEHFVDNLPEYLQRLNSSAAQRDHKGLLKVAHELKGTAASFGYPALSEAAADLEIHMKDPTRSVTDLSDHLSRMELLAERMRLGARLAHAPQQAEGDSTTVQEQLSDTAAAAPRSKGSRSMDESAAHN